MAEPQKCPCSSGSAYAECCRRYHKGGEEPPTPVALMRSRYSAFALKQVDHLVRTLHPEHPDARRDPAALRGDLRRTCNRLSYPALSILEIRDEDEDGNAFVRFRATVRDGERDRSFSETSRFRRHAGSWRYVDGTLEDRPG